MSTKKKSKTSTVADCNTGPRSSARSVGVWTRMSEKDGSPMGRLHAAERVDGSLLPDALCGFTLPSRALNTRPFMFFDSMNTKACTVCAAESSINERV